MIDSYAVDGVIEIVLQSCHTYDVEAFFIRRFVTREKGLPYLNCAYEVASAMGTVGLTTGLTPNLTPFSQTLIILLMYLGRVGVLSFSIALMTRGRTMDKIRYPEMNVMIG